MNGMTNLWGFEKQITLSRLTGGRFGLMQTPSAGVRAAAAPAAAAPAAAAPAAAAPAAAAPAAAPAAAAPAAAAPAAAAPARRPGARRHNPPTNITNTPTANNAYGTAQTLVTAEVIDGAGNRRTVHRLVNINHDGSLSNDDEANIIDALRRDAGAGEDGDHATIGQRVENISFAEHSGSGDVPINIRQTTITGARVANPSSATAGAAPAATPGAPPANNGAAGQGSATATPATNSVEQMRAQAEIDTARRNQEAQIQEQHAQADFQRQQTLQSQTVSAQAQAAAASRPNDAAQVISSIMNPIAGTFVGLGTAAAMASWGGNCYGGMGGLGGFGGMGGGGVNPFLPMSVASTFMNSGFNCGGGFNAMGGAGGMGGLDLIGMGNTFYGQALDERSRGRRLDAEINRLKAMIMMGNFDAILQAVTLLTLRSKGMLRQTAVAMINSVQTSNRQMEEQNRRLEALSSTGPNASSSSENQHQMMMINNNIQGINMDRQTAMNALRDMMSNLEEATSSEQNLRRSFEQIRQIQNRA